MQAETAGMSMDETSMHEGDGLGVTQDPPTAPAQDASVPFELDVGVPDDARSSTCSDKSDSKQPRSAMRRSSSNPKIPQSPRRVRFDFMGEEVLPTSSPQPTAFMSARMSSPEPADGEGNWASHLATEPGEEEEGSAPPRKVSSSDALRALSRVPLEDGTIWTVVNSDSEDAAPDQSQPLSHSVEDAPAVNDKLEPETSTTSTAINKDKHQSKSTASQSGQNLHNNNNNDDDEISSKPDHFNDESSDDDVLAMAKPKLSPSSVSRTAALLYPPGTKEQGATMPVDSNHDLDSPRVDVKQTSTSHDAAQEDEGIFRFEGDGSQLPETPPVIEDQKSEDEQSDHEDSGVEPALLSIYSSSPAISIIRRRDPNAEDRLKPQPEQTTVGSYKGRPLIASVMRNPELLAQLDAAEKIDEGLSSSDDGESSSPEEHDFEAALSAARSFSQRAAIEDMMEAAKSRQKSPKGPQK